MSDRTMISCVCPTHGRAHVIGEAVESWLRQHPCGLRSELLIVNDCPEQPLECDVPGVRVVNLSEPMTVNAKFDLAVELADGEFIAWWEDDDISLPRRLARSVVFSGMEHGYKQQTAWLWDPEEMAPTRNLLFGTAFFPKRLYQRSGGAGATGAPDANAFRNMAKAGTFANEKADPQDMFFVYRWAGVAVVHDSGFHGEAGLETPGAKLQAFRKRTLAHPQFRPGPQRIVPGWSVDYAALALRATEAERNRRTSGPVPYWKGA